MITEAAATRRWLHWAGVQRGADKAAWFRLADCYMSPGAVGLHVLDAFCAGVPLVTTDTALHGPEIAYLDSGRNGFVMPAQAEAFAGACLELLDNPRRKEQLCRAAAEDAARYTLDNMVRRFVCGLEGCLSQPRLVR